jgi:hypothetical protein
VYKNTAEAVSEKSREDFLQRKTRDRQCWGDLGSTFVSCHIIAQFHADVKVPMNKYSHATVQLWAVSEMKDALDKPVSHS